MSPSTGSPPDLEKEGYVNPKASIRLLLSLKLKFGNQL